MRWKWLLGWAGALSLLIWSAYSAGQMIPASPWLGLADSWSVEVEVIPGVRLRGVEVIGVVPGSPAARSGLISGDVILSANSGRIAVPDDLRRALLISGPRLRLQIFEARSGQVLNLAVHLGRNTPGAHPTAISVSGQLRSGVMAIGGETTGTTITDAGGRTFDLEFAAGMAPGPRADGRLAAVSGILKAAPGTERPGRRVILVDYFRLLGERSASKDNPRAMPF